MSCSAAVRVANGCLMARLDGVGSDGFCSTTEHPLPDPSPLATQNCLAGAEFAAVMGAEFAAVIFAIVAIARAIMYAIGLLP